MRATPYNIRLRPNSENLDNIFLLLSFVTCASLMAILAYINIKKLWRTPAATPKLPLPIRNVIEPIESEKVPRSRVRIRKKTEEQSDAFFDQISSKAFLIQTKKKRRSDASTVIPTLFLPHPALPAEIRFSDEFVYPSPQDSRYQIYPLPGPQKSQPVAKVKINGHNMLIRSTQFGVLTARDLPDESLIAAHERSLKNGQVVFAKDIRLFKTHPKLDGRIYATHQITTQDGLTLHLFDKTEQHAHRKK